MTERANILSFDEAKQGAKKRPSVAAPKKPAKRRTGANVVSVKPKAAKPKLAPAKPKPASAAGASRRTKAPARSASAPRSGSIAAAPRTTAASRSRTRSTSQGRSAQPARSSEAARGTSARASSSSRSAAPERDEAKKPSRLAQARRERAKSKADKAFTKQFGSQPSDASQAGPRAAVYKGEMGAKHKRATRMQGDGAQAKASGKRARFFADGSWRSSRAFIASVAVASCLVLTCLFLYPVAQQYYHSVRELDRLQAEYAAVEARNSAIKAEADQLATDAGVQDKARSEFGWVAKGENAVNVYGLDVEPKSGTVNANIPPGSIEAPTTWYSPVLDAIFGVK